MIRNLLISILSLALVLTWGSNGRQLEDYERQHMMDQAEIKSLETVINTINEQNLTLFEIAARALEDLEAAHRFLERFRVEEFEVTNYAPLGSEAVEGMCFEGDPNITASGQQFVPYLSAAAARDIPFGTKLWVEGIGYYEVHDRGGMITSGKLDLGVQETDEAFGFGRQNRLVLIEKY